MDAETSSLRRELEEVRAGEGLLQKTLTGVCDHRDSLLQQLEEVRKDRDAANETLDSRTVQLSKAYDSAVTELTLMKDARDNALAELERVRRSFTMEQFANGELRADLAAAKEENLRLTKYGEGLKLAVEGYDEQATALRQQLSAAQARADARSEDTFRLFWIVYEADFDAVGMIPDDLGQAREYIDGRIAEVGGLADRIRAAIDAASEGVGE